MEETKIGKTVAIVGGGFTGLTAARELLKKGYSVSVFEKEPVFGGLASGFEILPGISLEKFYHHWFTNDDDVLNLCRELGIFKKLNFLPSKTSIYAQGKIFPFDGPLAVLKFSPLKFIDRIRFGLVSLILKLVGNSPSMEKQTAVDFIKNWYGQNSFEIVWEPLLKGKFAQFHDSISLTWFWARIKKRTFKLVYPSGGFQVVIDALTDHIKHLGGQLKSGVSIESIKQETGSWQITSGNKISSFDALIVTSSIKTFIKMFPHLPEDYKIKIDSIKYISAQILILVLKKSLTPYYWVNINEKDFPFLALVEQTNFMKSQDYGGYRVVYLGNYLPDGDERLAMSKEQLIDLYEPYLKKINSQFDRSWVVKAVSFVGPFAQPIVDTSYKEKIPAFVVPGYANLFLATMAQVYPWDRGTNYAVKLAKDLVRDHF